MKFRNLIGMLVICFLFTGCADMDVPTPKKILRDPLGEGSLRTGMSKDKVKDIYGDPDIVDMVISPSWKKPREQWVYTATTSLPVGAGFLSEDIYLYFDGDSLTNISRKPLGNIQGMGR